MPHISSKKLKDENSQKLYTELVSALEKSANKSLLKSFLKDFLTNTERTMLAKRLAVIFLLSRGIPQSYIYGALRMSPATVARMSAKYEMGKYSSVTSIMKEDKSVWGALEKILRAGLPPVMGRGRWKFLYKSN